MAALVERRRDDEAAPQAVAPLIAALDIGVSKTTCLAARRDPVLEMHPDRPMRVLGVGVQSAPSATSGKGADFDACARTARVAIEEAAFMAGAPVQRVTASYAGPGLVARIARGATRVKSRVVTGRDIEAAVNAAIQSAPAAHMTHLHVEPLRYIVDDDAATPDPLGQPAKMLAVECAIVSAPEDAVNALRACVRAAGVEIDEIVAAPYAAGIAALTTDERDTGALVLDLGAGALGVAVFGPEGLLHAETQQLGGVRLTRDLAKKLETSFAAAERVKLAFGAVGACFDPKEAVQAPKLGAEGRLESATTLRSVIAETIAPRLHETMMAARDRLARAGFGGESGPQRAVLVGGGAGLPGIRELASEALAMPVRIGRPFELCGFDNGDAGPAYACAAGLLRWRLDNPTLADVEQSFVPSLRDMSRQFRTAATDAWGWLRENF